MCGLVCIFYFNFQMRVFAAFAVHAALFGRRINLYRFDNIAAKMQVQSKAGCRNQVQQHG